MFAGNFGGLYFGLFIGALGYAITMLLLNWHRHGWAHVRQALPRCVIALPLSLLTSTILLFALHLVGVAINNGKR
jgi:uncharacterized BrkB/YihY/UPF0761 family membrane protein